MSAVFLKILNMSMTASWLMLAVLIVRPLLRRAPRWLVCALWGVVAIRLICPFSFESVFSLVPGAEPVNTTVYNDRPYIQSGVETIDRAANTYIDSHQDASAMSAAPEPVTDPFFVFAVVWVIGVCVLSGYALISYLRLKRQVAASVCYSDVAGMDIQTKIMACDDISYPFILGVIRPVIYVPSSLDASAGYFVLTHEAAHIRRCDHWWKPLGYLILCVHWFNPLCWISYILLCRDIELACDEKVVKDMENAQKAGYSQTLLDLGHTRRIITACPVAFGEVGVKERVKGILNYKKPAFWVVAISAILCVAVSVCFLTDPKQEANAVLKRNLESATSEPIRELIYEDWDKDGNTEAIGITSETVDELGYCDAKYWYVTGHSCDQIGSSAGMSVYPDSIKKYSVKHTWIITFEAGAGGSGRDTYMYSFDADGAHTVGNTASDLTYLGGDEFAVSDSRYDASVDGTGQTWNTYYLQWDGEKLVEYGGLRISQDELKKVPNGTEIINQIEKQIKNNGTIGDIYYRANGMVFVNYTADGANHNVTLKLENGKLSYAAQNDYGETELEQATGDGIIQEHITDCVVYPDKFPLNGVKRSIS